MIIILNGLQFIFLILLKNNITVDPYLVNSRQRTMIDPTFSYLHLRMGLGDPTIVSVSTCFTKTSITN